VSALASVIAHNPDLLDRDALVDGFVARLPLFTALMDALRGQSLQHFALIGARGMGKTTILRRLKVGIDEDPELSARWLPVGFPEEQYNVQHLSDFWLNALGSISESLESRGSPDARGIAEQINVIQPLDEARRVSAAIEALKAYSRRISRGLVLLVDGVGRVWDRLSEPERWALRAALSDGRIVLIAANETSHKSLTDYGSAFYEFFRIETLRPLGSEELRTTLRVLAERADTPDVLRMIADDPGRIEAMRRLTGGNPRAAVLVHRVLARSEERTIADDVLALLDSCTPYYKARVEALSVQAQPIFDAVALQWAPATAASVARRTRLASKQVSAQMGRLVSDGVLETIELTGRRVGYQIAERLWNIWYLMRASTRARRKLIWLAELLHEMYGGAKLRERARALLDKPPNSAFDPEFVLACASVLGLDAEARAMEWEALAKIAARKSDFEAGLRTMLDLHGEDAHLEPAVSRMEGNQRLRRVLSGASPAADGSSAFDVVGGLYFHSMKIRLFRAEQIVEGRATASQVKSEIPHPFAEETLCAQLARDGVFPLPEETGFDYRAFGSRWPAALNDALLVRFVHVAHVEPAARIAALRMLVREACPFLDLPMWTLLFEEVDRQGASDDCIRDLAELDGTHRDDRLMMGVFVHSSTPAALLAARCAFAAARLRGDVAYAAMLGLAFFGWDSDEVPKPDQPPADGIGEIPATVAGPAALIVGSASLWARKTALAMDWFRSGLRACSQSTGTNASSLALACRAAFHTGQAESVAALLREYAGAPVVDLALQALHVATDGPLALNEVEAEARDVVAHLARLITMAPPERIEFRELPRREPPTVPVRRPRRRKARTASARRGD